MRIFEQSVSMEDDVFALRQRSRQIAAAAGFDDADQVRLATALSEVGRDLVRDGNRGRVTFDFDDRPAQLVVTITSLRELGADRADGIAAARRLVPTLVIETDEGQHLARLSRPLPRGLSPAELGEVRAAVAGVITLSPIEELRVQNGELVRALEQLQAQHAEVVALNAELEETNAGVMAMYTQLSEELETTNRGVVALYADLDDTTQRLQHATEAKTRFLNSVSHELRSPVNSVIGLAGLLLDPIGGIVDPDARRQAELIRSAGEELLELVNQLLDLARAESGKLQVASEPADIAAIAAEVAEALAPLVPDAVRLRCTADGVIPLVRTDPTLVRQILRNLLANALSFTTTGTVDVRTRWSTERGVVVEVVDTGIGIADEHLGAIFDEFFQVRNPLQAARRGSGLGLPYSRKVAELLGGTLRATSVAGRGSSFELHLPNAPVGAEADEVDDDMVVPGRGRVLVVDDDPGFRILLTNLLATASTMVGEAPDGTTAVQMMRNDQYDLVVLDLVMPDVDGAAVLAVMGDDPRLRTVPVIIVTSMNLESVPVPATGQVKAVLAKQGLDRRHVSRVLARLVHGQDGAQP